MTQDLVVTLIPCRSCEKNISADAVSCPACGGVNDWVHPRIAAIVTHLTGLDQECRVEARGHVLHAVTMHHNLRQSLGGLAMLGGMICLPLGFFFAPMVGLAIFLIDIGGALTGFGLSAATRKELAVDLRLPGQIVGPCDRHFWAGALAILSAPPPHQHLDTSMVRP